MWAWLTHFDTKNMELEGDEDSEPVKLERAASSRRTNLLVGEQINHTFTVASRVYAVSNLDFRYVDREKLHNFNLCSMELHTLLGTQHNIQSCTYLYIFQMFISL
jgi:hypothetical protein